MENSTSKFHPDMLRTEMAKHKTRDRRSRPERADRSRAGGTARAAAPAPEGAGPPENAQSRRPRPAQGPGGARPAQAKRGPARRPDRDTPHWIYGTHAALQALRNPRRSLRRLIGTAETLAGLSEQIGPYLADRDRPPTPERVTRQDLEVILPEGAVHQGLAVLVSPLPAFGLRELLLHAQNNAPGPSTRAGSTPQRKVSRLYLALDQVTDPHNVGAVLRSAVAFGAAGLLVTDRHAPSEGGVLAKAASGALDLLPIYNVPNLSRALAGLRSAGYWSYGLAEEADVEIGDLDPAARSVLVLGAEGTGLRRLTRETCDQLVGLPTSGPLRSLNVSNAAAVALYALTQAR